MNHTPDYPFHEVSELFPLMRGQEFADLKADIQQHGQREPVWLFRGAIIDGRNRYRACRDLGRPVQTREYDGEEADLVAFVVSLNLKRRHLDESQRAAIAAKLANLKPGRPAANGKAANLPISQPPISQARAAELMNVSPRSVREAAKVLRDGTPELAAAVEAGRASVSAAAAVAELPQPVQAEVVAAGPTAIVRKAAEVRQGKKAQRVEVKPVAPPAAPPAKPARQWSAVEGEVFSSPLRKVLSEVKLAGGIVEYAGFMTPAQRADAVKKLRSLISDINSWIKALEK